jgi:hypothetical protein
MLSNLAINGRNVTEEVQSTSAKPNVATNRTTDLCLPIKCKVLSHAVISNKHEQKPMNSCKWEAEISFVSLNRFAIQYRIGPIFANCIIIFKYEAKGQPSGEFLINSGISSHRPVTAIHEPIPKNRDKSWTQRFVILFNSTVYMTFWFILNSLLRKLFRK